MKPAVIKNIREFEKLFKVHVPVSEHLNYYLDILSLSDEYKKLSQIVQEFIIMEENIKEKGFSSIGNYKMDFAFKVLKEHLEKSEAYKKFMEFDYSKISFRSKDELKNNQGEALISFDLVAANFNTFKAFDSQESPEIAQSWEQQCNDLNIEHALGISKSFRQLTFGNINPKRNQKIQHMFMLDFIEKLFKKGYTEEDIVFISHDEVVVKRNLDRGMEETSSDIIYHDVNHLLGFNEKVVTPIKRTIFKLEKIKNSKVYIKYIYKYKNHGFAGKVLKENHKELWGAPGNQYYMLFKKHILDSDVYDARDLYFINEGKLAQWII